MNILHTTEQSFAKVLKWRRCHWFFHPVHQTFQRSLDHKQITYFRLSKSGTNQSFNNLSLSISRLFSQNLIQDWPSLGKWINDPKLATFNFPHFFIFVKLRMILRIQMFEKKCGRVSFTSDKPCEKMTPSTRRQSCFSFIVPSIPWSTPFI